jgi:hypothetical protein
MSHRRTIADLRDHLFDTLEALRDKEHPMDLDRAKTIADVAQTVINSAKVEVDAARAIGAARLNTPFLPAITNENGKS